jgi:cytoskeletal protein CcmA (bactofilin family)
MARSSFLRGRGEEGENVSIPAAGGPLTAFIDQGSCFEGKLSFQDTVRIDGRFNGEISSENTLIVGESGEIEASVRSRNVIVSGRVVGNVYASHQLVLHKTAQLQGDVETSSLVVEEGAQLNGRIAMKAASGAANPLALVKRGGSSDPAPDA